MNEWNENNKSEGRANSFGLPEGYFQKSARSVLNKIEWQNEHKDFLRLPELKGRAGFEIPENYFRKNGYKLEMSCYPALKDVKVKDVFVVPENYFDENKRLVLQASLRSADEPADDLKTKPLIVKTNPFTTPGNYFETKADSLTKALLPASGRVINLFSKRLGFSVAAMLMLAMGVWMYVVYFNRPAEEDCGTIACLDKKDLMKTKTLERMDDDELYELVDPTVLEKRIQDTGVDDLKNKINDTNFKEISVEDLLDGI